MPVTYDSVPAEVPDMVAGLIDEFHPELAEAEVSIDYLFAFNDRGPAVKLHGYPCQATIKVNGYKARKQGLADATIEIDGANWLGKTEDEQRALLDHEIEHLVVLRDKKTGEIKRDSLDRPRLKCRLHDYELGGFRVIAERHGQAAPEVQHAAHWQDRFGQMLMEWGEEKAPRVKRSGKAVAGSTVGSANPTSAA